MKVTLKRESVATIDYPKNYPEFIYQTLELQYGIYKILQKKKKKKKRRKKKRSTHV